MCNSPLFPQKTPLPRRLAGRRDFRGNSISPFGEDSALFSQPKVNSPASSSVTVCAPPSALSALEMPETSPKAWP